MTTVVYNQGRYHYTWLGHDNFGCGALMGGGHVRIVSSRRLNKGDH